MDQADDIAERGFEPDPRLIERIVQVESSGNPRALSAKGARGLMQVMPATARAYGFDPERLFDPDYNRMAGYTIFRDYLNKAGGDPHTALMMYNAGPSGYRRGKAREQAKEYANKVLGVIDPDTDMAERGEPQKAPQRPEFGHYSEMPPEFGRAMAHLLSIPTQQITEAVEPIADTVLGSEAGPPMAQAVGGALGGLMAVPEGGVMAPLAESEIRVTPPPRAAQPGPVEDVEFEDLAERPHINDIARAPAIRTPDGEVVEGQVGERHIDIMNRTENLPARVEHGFVTHDGRFLNRTQARNLLNSMGAQLPAGKPESIDMIERPALPEPAPGKAIAMPPPSEPAPPIPVGPPARMALPPPQEPAEAPAEATAGPVAQPQENSPAIPQETAPVPAPGAGLAPGHGQPAPAIPTQGKAPVVVTGVEGKPIVAVRPQDAVLDPDTFQYKTEVNKATGRGKSLENTKYDWKKAGLETFWWDADNEQLYVSHGHHRHPRAIEAGEPTVYGKMLDSGYDEPGAVLHGVTKEEAKAIGAIENFSEGRGTVIDAATYLRHNQKLGDAELADVGIDLNQRMMQEALALRNLTDPIWHEVAIGRLKPEIGAVIARELKNPKDQLRAYASWMKQAESGKPYGPEKFETMLRLISDAPEISETQQDLFGAHTTTRTTWEEQADIISHAKKELSEARLGTKTVLKQRERLTKIGNTIAVAESAAAKDEAERRLAVLDLYKPNKGMDNIKAVLNRYGRYLAEKPAQRKEILREAYDQLLSAIDQDTPGTPEPDTSQKSLF